MKEQVQTYLENTFPDWQDVHASEPERIAIGWETEIFSFDIDYNLSDQSAHENIIMRMYPSDDAMSKSRKEFSAMKQLGTASYPVPEVHHLELDNSPWGKPFILMERIEGSMMWPKLVHSSPANQEALLIQFCDLFVQLHQLDWRSVVNDLFHKEIISKYTFIDKALDQLTKYSVDFNLAGFAPIIKWLQDRRNAVPCDQPAIIHFDFHPGNILLQPDGKAVVLDWSGFDISDSRLDLASTLVLFSSYEGAAWRERILNTYERLLGGPVKQIEYFEVYACARRLLSIVISMQGDIAKLGMNPDAVTLMKEQMFAHQRVYKLLRERTDIRVGEVENILAMFLNEN